MRKLYFKNGAEHCFTAECHIDQMKFNDETEREVFRAKVDYVTGYFFCRHYFEVGQVGESCGKQCPKYAPRNGRSGICKHHGFLYEQTNKSLILKVIK